jgi:hypothetical protein
VDCKDPAGGSVALAKLFDEFGEAITADFQSVYGLNIVREIEQGMSPAQIIVLIRQLPLESRTVSARRGGDEFLGWGVDRYMFAQLLDAVQMTTHAVVQSNSKKKVKAPKPVYRPGKKPKVANPFRTQLEMAKKLKEG